MMSDYIKIEGFNVWNDNYDDYKGKYELSGIIGEGMCMRFARWLSENNLSEDTAEDVYNNTSGLRDGNRLDIHENYYLSDDGRYQISYIWALENGIVYAEVYDSDKDEYVGNIEVHC